MARILHRNTRKNEEGIRMDKGSMRVPSMRGRMAHMRCRNTHSSVPNAKETEWRKEGLIRMAKGDMLAPSMRWLLCRKGGENHNNVSSAETLG
jgi:hypothetical protein